VLSFPQIKAEAKKIRSCEDKQIIKKKSQLLNFSTSQPLVVGDIVINLQQAKRQAKEHGMTFYEELTRLLIHGLLHLLGYDHERNKYHARKMRRIEKELIEAIGKR
jgi:rRNA maturation RNase YbeY